MPRLASLLLVAVIAGGCGLSPASPASLSTALPKTINGQTIEYEERSVSEMGAQREFFDDAIRAVGGDPGAARVAIGQVPGGSTLTAIRVPGSDARHMVDELITAAAFQQTDQQTVDVGGRSVTVLTLPPTTHDRAYVYAFADTVVIMTTSQPAMADEAFGALP